MRFKLDENLPLLAQQTLTALGHDAHTVADENLQGASDDTLMHASTSEARVLVTLDLDFADLRTYPPGSHAGVWVLRPPRQSIHSIAALLTAACRLARTETVHGQLWIVEDQRVRIRDIGPR